MSVDLRSHLQTAFNFLALGGLIAAGVALQIAGHNTSSEAEVDVHFGAAHFPTYRNLQQMNSKSTVVLEGRVVRVFPSHRVVPRGFSLGKVPKSKRSRLGIIETDASIKVTRVIRGHTSAKLIRVSQLGGRIGKERLIVSGEPLVTNGRTYVLFLRRGKGSATYSIVGGLQGRYLVRNGRLSVVSGAALTLPVPAVLHGQQFASFSHRYGSLLHSSAFSSAVPPPATRQQPLRRRPRIHKPTAQGNKPPVPPGR